MPIIKRSLAFTLIELLIVISIIATLSAILFPVFGTARSAAQSKVCLSNLHSLSLGVQLYRSDADDYFPLGVDGENKRFPVASEPEDIAAMKSMPLINDLLQPYVTSQAIWRCPLDIGGYGDLAFTGSLYSNVGSSYHYQTFLALDHASDPVVGRIDSRPDLHFNPSQIILLRDASPFWHGQRDAMLEKYNAVFVDGHAGSAGFSEDTFNVVMQFD